MRRLILPLLVVGLVAACSKQEPPAPPAAMPEVNDANCHPDALKAMPDDALRKKFAGLCLRRGSLQKGSDQGLKP